MKKLWIILLIALLLIGCDTPPWANFEIFVKDNGDIVKGPYYCISWDQQEIMFYCEQPESIIVIGLEPGYTLQVWDINKVMP